ncbi:hypothetical protein M9458_052012, partial [Cirrhinus mrigala]
DLTPASIRSFTLRQHNQFLANTLVNPKRGKEHLTHLSTAPPFFSSSSPADSRNVPPFSPSDH